MPNTFFTSDTHFGHTNILKVFCPKTRRGETVEEMDRIIIENWQSQVMPDDDVWVLGDVFFCHPDRAIRILQQLPGHKHLIWGNHDKIIKESYSVRAFFEDYHDYKEINLHKKKVVLHHFPYLEWHGMYKGWYSLFGHVHANLDNHPEVKPYRCMDVGIDSRPDADMKLWTWEEIDRRLSKKEIKNHFDDPELSEHDE